MSAFLVNKAKSGKEVRLSLQNFVASGGVAQCVFTGRSGAYGGPENDPAPTIEYRGAFAAVQGEPTFQLDPVSVTVLKIP